MRTPKQFKCPQCKKVFITGKYRKNQTTRHCSPQCASKNYQFKQPIAKISRIRTNAITKHRRENLAFWNEIVVPKIAQARQGKKRNPESIKKMVQTRKARNNYNHTLTTRQKMSIAIKQGCAKPESKIRKSNATKTYWDKQEYVDKMKNKRIPWWNTKPEQQMARILTQLNLPYKQGRNMNELDKNRYCADFYLPFHNAVIEVDGLYWHHYPTGNMKDHIRTKQLRRKGYKVCRFWENEINAQNVFDKLFLQKPSILT